MTVDGYSYLQENERAKPVSAPVVRRRPLLPGGTGGSNRVSPMPLIVGVAVLVLGFLGMKFFSMCRGSRLREEARARKRRQLRRRRLPQAGRARQQLKHRRLSLRAAPVASPVPAVGPPETRKALAANSTAPAEPEVRKGEARH